MAEVMRAGRTRSVACRGRRRHTGLGADPQPRRGSPTGAVEMLEAVLDVVPARPRACWAAASCRPSTRSRRTSSTEPSDRRRCRSISARADQIRPAEGRGLGWSPHDDQRARRCDRPRVHDPGHRCGGRACAASPSPNPWVGAVAAHRRRRHCSTGRPRSPAGRHAEVVALRRGGRQRPGRHALRHPRALLATTAAPARAPTRSSTAGVARVVVGIEDPDPAGGRAGARSACGAAGIEVTVGVQAERGRARSSRPYLKHRTHRSALRRAEAGRLRSTAAPRRPTARASGSPRRRGARRRPPPAGRVRRHPRRRRHGPARRPVAHRARLPPAGACPGNARSIPVRVVLGTAADRTPRSTRAARSSGDLGAVLDELGADGVLQLLVEGGASVGGRRSTAPAWSTATSSTSPRRCSAATTPTGLFDGAGACDIDDVWRGRFVVGRAGGRRPARRAGGLTTRRQGG